MSGMPESNVEKLLMAILTKDPSYVVKPESRIEALLFAIYENGGSGGGGAFKSGTVKTCVLKDTPVYGYKVGDKYIDFVLNNDDEEEEQHVYVLVSDLVDDKAIGISYDNTVSKLEAENIQAAIDELVASKLEVDDELSDISENPVQNKVVKEAIDSLITLPDTTAEVGQIVKVKSIGSDNKPSEFEYGNVPEMTAENVSYDNSKSELDAENVQDAIDSMKDEFYSELEDVNTSLTDKANSDEVYTKAETYAKTEVYTKTQTDKAITDEVAKIVADAPEDFDTLKEMSDWISNHEESAAAMNTAIAGKITAPSTASVNQILRVKTVDGNGKPTAWETVTSVPVANGGTGATSASSARTNLGLGSAATKSTTSSITGSTNLPTDTAVKTYVDNAVGGKVAIPQTATVGQILSVKAVDEDGKPTEWETINKGTLCNYSLNGTTLTITTL